MFHGAHSPDMALTRRVQWTAGFRFCPLSNALAPPPLTRIVSLLRTMSSLPPDTKAMRQTIYARLIAFPVGFLLVLVALGLLIARVATPETRWWEILHISINSILISLFGGLCFYAAAATVVSRLHYRRGAYRCRFCDR